VIFADTKVAILQSVWRAELNTAILVKAFLVDVFISQTCASIVRNVRK
jgi:hypothetical protein